MMHGVGKIGLKANFGFSETTLCLVHAIQNPHECHHRKYENLQMAPDGAEQSTRKIDRAISCILKELE